MAIAALYRVFNVDRVDYPFVASVHQTLLWADEAVIIVAKQSKDDTLQHVLDLIDEYPGRVKLGLEDLVLDRMWQVKFTEAAKELTKCDWLAIVDADEAFHEKHAEQIRKETETPGIKLIRYRVTHFYGTPRYRVTPGKSFFYTHHCRMGHRSVDFRLQNFRTDHNIAPTCDVMATINGRAVKAHIYRGPEILESQAPIFHYGFCKLLEAQAIRRVIGDGWYANDERYLHNALPDVKEKHNYRFKEMLTHLERYDGSHPAAVEKLWFDEVHEAFWNTLENQV